MVAEMVGNLARRTALSAVMSVVFITTAAWAWRANTGAAGGGDDPDWSHADSPNNRPGGPQDTA